MSERHAISIHTVALAVVAVVIGACGGAAAPAPAPTATAAANVTLAPATAAPATAAPATAAPATTAPTSAPAEAAVLNIEAGENGGGFYLKADRYVIPAGDVTINFANAGKLTHEMLVYPLQDVTKTLLLSRTGKAHTHDLIPGIVANQEDVKPGQTATVSVKLAPGLYEIACHLAERDAMGMTFTHFDKGQILTLAVTGPGGPATSIAQAGSTINIDMKGEEASSWLFVPDRLVVRAGLVTFEATNSMREEHDVIVHPLGDTTMVVDEMMEHGGGHYDNWDLVKGITIFHDLTPGATRDKDITLGPGLYMAACYMMSKAADGTSFIHRDRGQRIIFEVR